MSLEELNSVLEPKNYIGRCPEQVTEFIENDVMPVLDNTDIADVKVELKV